MTANFHRCAIALFFWQLPLSTLAADGLPQPATPAASDAYQLPAGGAEKLIPFIVRLRNEKTPDADYARKMSALSAAGRKLVAQASDADRKLPGYDEAVGIWLYVTVFETRSPDARTELLAVAQKQLETSASNTKEAIAAMMVMIEWYAKDPDRAQIVCRDFLTALAASQDPQAPRHSKKLAGTLRRLTLLGQPMTFTGTEVDGTPFDVARFRGKVVLVDFWATWCGPCLAEVDNLKRNFQQYHERGFEVVGISMDEDRDALTQHLAKETYPWPTLHDPTSRDDHVALAYGITSLPTLILIDREGKVVSVNARGKTLDKKLAELLGKPEDDTGASAQ